MKVEINEKDNNIISDIFIKGNIVKIKEGTILVIVTDSGYGEFSAIALNHDNIDLNFCETSKWLKDKFEQFHGSITLTID